MTPADPFDYDLEELRERYSECPEGAGDDHFKALALLGQCPYCGMDEDEASERTQASREKWAS